MFNLTIRTPYEDIYKGEVSSLTFASEKGEMQVLEDHSDITATILFSPIFIEEDGLDETFLARNGIMLFDNETNSATILALYCEKQSEVSYGMAREYAEFIEKQLEEGEELSSFQKLYLKKEKVAVEEQLRRTED